MVNCYLIWFPWYEKLNIYIICLIQINNDVNEEEDELERKRREQQAIKDADMENTKEMFGGLAIQG